jgi:hypothetical protein
VAIAAVLASGLDELLDLAAREIAPARTTEVFTVFGVSPATARMCMK